MFQTNQTKKIINLDTGPPLQARPNRTATIHTLTTNTTNPSSFNSGSRTRDRNGTFFLSFFVEQSITNQSKEKKLINNNEIFIKCKFV